MYCPYSRNCESLEFAQAEAIDATFTGLFAQVIHLHVPSCSCRALTSQTGVCSGWSHGSHIHPWDWPITASTIDTIVWTMWQTAHGLAICLDRCIFCLTGQRFGLVLHIHRHSNPTMDYKWPKKFIGANIQGAVLGPETSTKLWVLKDPAHHFPRKESSTSAFHLHLCDWPHDPRVSCHPCQGNCGQYIFIYIYI